MTTKKKPSINSSIIASLANDTPFNPDSEIKTEGEKNEVGEEDKENDKKKGNALKKGPSTEKPKKKVDIENDDNYIFKEAGVPFQLFDKSTKKLSYISQKNHEKLTMLANETGYNIMDMSDSIISHFFEQNKGLIKKIMQKKISNIWE